MTPCEELGYKVGDLFTYTGVGLFSPGSTVELWEDDGSNCPAFKCVQGECTDGTGDDWAFVGLGRVKKIKEAKDMIVKANGEPYATYESAKQQLSAKGLGDTHEVVEHGVGYGIAPKDSGRDGAEEVFELTPGDYVKLGGMSDEQCALVAEAMIYSGAKPGKGYPYRSGVGEWDIIFWDAENGLVNRSTSFRHPGAIREVTVNQIVGREDQVTLRPGDYVRSRELSGDKARSVADAFICAGARPGGGYPYETGNPDWDFLIWNSESGLTDRALAGGFGMLRELTISQALSATNAKRQDEPEETEDQQDEPCPSVLDTLRLAQQRVNELSNELGIAEGVRDEALEAVRAELGEGFEIGVVEGVPAGEDMSDPANWRAGDMLECTYEFYRGYDKGAVYEVYREFDEDSGSIGVVGEDPGQKEMRLASNFKFHSRPAK